MPWCRRGDKPLFETMLIRRRWVKVLPGCAEAIILISNTELVSDRSTFICNRSSLMNITETERLMLATYSSLAASWNCRFDNFRSSQENSNKLWQWLQCNLSKRKFPVRQETKILSPWRPPCFSDWSIPAGGYSGDHNSNKWNCDKDMELWDIEGVN